MAAMTNSRASNAKPSAFFTRVIPPVPGLSAKTAPAHGRAIDEPHSAAPDRRRVMTWLPYLAGLFAMSALILLVIGALLKD